MLAALALALAAQDPVPLAGLAVDEEGRPVPHAVVILVQLPEDSFTPAHAYRVATTREDGTFAWKGARDLVPDLPMLVVLSRAGCGVTRLELDQPTRIVVPPSRDLSVRLVDGGRPLADRALRLVPGDSFFGGPDATRPAQWDDEPTRRMVEALFSARTESDGVARFADLPRGPGFEAWRLILGAHSVPLRIWERDEVQVDVSALRTATVTGVVVDERERPIAGAVVSTRWFNVRWLESSDHILSVTGADGRYRLEGVPLEEGKATLRVHCADHLPVQERPLLFGGDDELEWDFTLWRLAPIRGRVLDPDGEPVRGVRVQARRPWKRVAVTSAETDLEGRFALEPVVAGPYSLVVPSSSHAGYIAHAEPAFACAGEEDVLVRASTYSTQTSALRVRFVEEGSQEPVTPDYVMLVPRGSDYGRGAPYPGTPGPTGTTFQAVPRGEWVLIAGGAALQPEHVPVTVGPGPGDLEVEMHYPVTAPLAGRVVFPGEEEPPLAWVRAEWRAGDATLGAQHYAWEKVAPDGGFDLGAVYEGRVTLHLSTSGWVGRKTMTLGPLGDERVELEARRGAELELVPDGYTPSARFVLEVASADGAWQVVGDQHVGDGERELYTTTVAPGDWRWRVRIERAHRRGGRPVVVDIAHGRTSLRPGERTRVRVPVGLPGYP